MNVLKRVRNLLRRERLDAEIEEELRPHLETAVEDVTTPTRNANAISVIVALILKRTTS